MVVDTMSLPTERSLRLLEEAHQLFLHGYIEYRNGEIWRVKDKGAQWRELPRHCEQPDENGYLHINIGRYTAMSHRVIWYHFKGPIPLDREIDHIDTIKAHNWIENLELVTRSVNVIRAYDKGLHTNTRAYLQRVRSRALTAEQILYARDMRGVICQAQIAKHLGICQQMVSSIQNGKRYLIPA